MLPLRSQNNNFFPYRQCVLEEIDPGDGKPTHFKVWPSSLNFLIEF